MDRLHAKPGLLVALAALSPGLASTARAQSLALQNVQPFEFNGSWLRDQNKAIDPTIVSGAQKVDMSGLQFGDLHLSLQVQKSAPATDPLPVLRYTVAAAQRDWLRSIRATGPTRLSLSGSFDTGAAQGLSFGFTRQRSGVDGFTDNRLGFSRSGIDLSLRMRDVGAKTTRTSLMSDDEWNGVKDLLGWRQTDVSAKWTGGSGLTLGFTTNRGSNAASGATRQHDRMDLAWKPNDATSFAIYDDRNASGARDKSERGSTRGLTLHHAFSGYTLDFGEDILRNAGGKTGQTRRLSFATPGNGFLSFKADLNDARVNGQSSQEQRFTLQTRQSAPFALTLLHVQNRAGESRGRQDSLQFRARPTARLTLEGNYLTTDAKVAATRDGSLKWNWTPGKDWQMQGALRQRTGMQDAADIRITGSPARATRLEMRLLRPEDPKSPFRRQDTLHLERTVGADTRLVADYSDLQTRAGQSAGITHLAADIKRPFGNLAADWLTGGGAVQPDQAALTFAGKFGPNDALHLDAKWKRMDGAPVSRSATLAWTVRPGLSLDGAYARNPQDKDGRIQDAATQSVGVHCDIASGLKLDLCYAREERPGFTSRRADIGIKGKVDGLTELDLGLVTRAATALPRDPAYRVSIRREVDKDHRFLVNLERQTKAVQGRNDLTARFELVSDFR